MSHSQKICVIDDDSSIRWVLDKALQKAGLAVTSFESGDAALSAIGREEPAVVVTDIRMPGIDGLELLERINSQYPELPVIIMTAHSDLDSAVAAYKGGAFEYLPKPFDVNDAVATVVHVETGNGELGAVLLQRFHLFLRQGIGDGPRAVRRRDIVIHRGERSLGPPDLSPGQPKPLERLRRSHLVDIVPVDIEDRVSVRLFVHDVGLPDLLVDVPWLGHHCA